MGILCVELLYLDVWCDGCCVVVCHYQEVGFGELVALLVFVLGLDFVWYLYVIWYECVDELQCMLIEVGIGACVYYRVFIYC